MNVELIGVIASVGEPTPVSEKTTIRNFVLEVQEQDGEYSKTQYYPMQLVNKNVDKLSASNSGDQVTVKGNLEGRKFTKKDGTEGFILSMTAWYVKVEQSNGVEQVAEEDESGLPF
jgi:single-stranded DNA-binding protein